MPYETNLHTKHTKKIISVHRYFVKIPVFFSWIDVEADMPMWRMNIISRWFHQSYRRPYIMEKARGKEEEETLGILASSNSSSLVDTFLGCLLLFPFPIVEELVEYTISSVLTLLMMSSQSTIKLSRASHRPVLSSDTKKTINFTTRWSLSLTYSEVLGHLVFGMTGALVVVRSCARPMKGGRLWQMLYRNLKCPVEHSCWR